MNHILRPAPSQPIPQTTAGGLDLNYVETHEVDEFVAKTEAYERGDLDADSYRAYRLTRGVYGQRQDGVNMMRVKIPGGLLAPDQGRRLAELLDESKLGYGNITTRTNLQIHHVAPETVPGWKARLNSAGISQLDACGNAVRTVTQDPYAGLAPDEVFDTTPYMQAITRFFLDHPRAQLMPRKFKIALSTSAADRGLTAINDLGLIAVVGPDGGPAFQVGIGGGLASLPQTALIIHEAWPAAEVLTPILAAIDLFQAHGNRRVRSKARIKHVLRKLKAERFTALYQTFLTAVQADPPPRVEVETPIWRHHPWTLALPQSSESAEFSAAFLAWARSSVRPTRLQGQVFVTVRFDHGGRVSGDALRTLADLSERFADGLIALTPQQNALLRGVHVHELTLLFAALQDAGMAQPGALHAGNATSCPGTSTCNLGITTSRQLAADLRSVLADRLDDDLTIKISGCHNSCGQHHIGTIGFYGAVKRIDGRAAPHYRVLVGGGVGPEGARFGTAYGLVPARRIQAALTALLAWADSHKTADESAGDALRRATRTELTPLLARFCNLSATQLQADDFTDLGLNSPFVVLNRKGECAA